MFSKKQRAYQSVLMAPDGSIPADAKQVVLADLARFSRLLQPPTRHDLTGRVDPIATAQMVGRQEVVQRIMAMCHITPQQAVILGAIEQHVAQQQAQDSDDVFSHDFSKGPI